MNQLLLENAQLKFEILNLRVLVAQLQMKDVQADIAKHAAAVEAEAQPKE